MHNILLQLNNDIKHDSSVIKICGSNNNYPITYTWSNINVYYTINNSNLWNPFLKKSGKIGNRKHILKNGKY
jgi:hypothetical protein